jgi:hypothetical protein
LSWWHQSPRQFVALIHRHAFQHFTSISNYYASNFMLGYTSCEHLVTGIILSVVMRLECWTFWFVNCAPPCQFVFRCGLVCFIGHAHLIMPIKAHHFVGLARQHQFQ